MSTMLYPALLLMVRIHEKYPLTFLTEHCCTSVLQLLLSAAAFHSGLFIAHLEFAGDCKLCALFSLLHVSFSNSLWPPWSVWGAHARPDRQTALSTGCPFFALAQPITQSQYKHSFLWFMEPLWKRPFNWSSIKGAQPTRPPHQQSPSQPPPSPPPSRRPFTERSSDKQDTGSKLQDNQNPH